MLLTAKGQPWDPAEMLRVLLLAELEGRERSVTESRRKAARFAAGKTFDTWDQTRSSIPTGTQQALRSLEWIDGHENPVVCGPPAREGPPLRRHRTAGHHRRNESDLVLDRGPRRPGPTPPRR